MKFERSILLFILSTMPVTYAAVQPRFWVWYAAAVYFTFLFAWWRNKVTFRENGLAAWPVYLFFAWTLFLLLPIPPELLQKLSPFRASMLDHACEMLGVGCGAGAVSYLQGLAVSRWSLWLAAALLAMFVRTASRDGKFLKALVVVLLVVVAMEAFYGGQMGFHSVIERFMQIDQETGRLNLWRDAWLIIQQHPFGVGPGNFEIVEPVFQVNAQTTKLSIHTHNDYLQLLVETGWPGFLRGFPHERFF